MQNDTALVNVTVTNVNEWAPHFDREDYVFSVNHSGTIPVGIQIGRVRVTDDDLSDRISLQLKPTPHARSIESAANRITDSINGGLSNRAFSINDDGEIVVTDVAELNSTSVSLTVVARDSGIPPRQVIRDWFKRQQSTDC